MTEYIIDWDTGLVIDTFSKNNLREEIVRCRDCKHYELLTVSYSDKPFSVCTAEWCEGMERDNPLVEPDGFCAWGIKKGDDR